MRRKSGKRIWRVAGINFDFRHMDHLLTLAHREPNAEIVGVCHDDPKEMAEVISHLSLPREKVFTDWRACLETVSPDIVVLCPASGVHGLWVERMASYGVHVLLEKPMAASLAEADAMLSAMQKAGRQLAINWPLAWYPPHVTAFRLLRQGRIGDLQEVHFYDGNRGPVLRRSLKQPPDPTRAEKLDSWFYNPVGGGALLDYLGYGATLATWYFDGKVPSTVTAVTAGPADLPVEEQSVTLARYGDWISSFHTRWGTFTDPWIHQPQPKCGFVLKGTKGTISNYDYESTIRLQTRRHPSGQVVPVDAPRAPRSNPVQYFLHCLENGLDLDGPLSPAISRCGQQIVDTARESARLGRTLPLLP